MIIDFLLKKTSLFFSLLLCLLFLAIIIFLANSSSAAWQHYGVAFLLNQHWNPGLMQFSALSSIIDTVITAVLALLIALPLCTLFAIFCALIAPRHISNFLATSSQVAAGIPSVIFGMWGLFILCPWLAKHIEPHLISQFAHIPFLNKLFSGAPLGIGILPAALVLSIMIIPFLSSMLVDLLKKTPHALTESSYAIGATRWEVIKTIYFPYLKTSIIGSIILSLGRALGETMAVTFVIGNSHLLSSSLLMPGNTIASTIANEFAEASSGLYQSSLMALAVILLLVSFVPIIAARIFLLRCTPC